MCCFLKPNLIWLFPLLHQANSECVQWNEKVKDILLTISDWQYWVEQTSDENKLKIIYWPHRYCVHCHKPKLMVPPMLLSYDSYNNKNIPYCVVWLLHNFLLGILNYTKDHHSYWNLWVYSTKGKAHTINRDSNIHTMGVCGYK